MILFEIIYGTGTASLQEKTAHLTRMRRFFKLFVRDIFILLIKCNRHLRGQESAILRRWQIRNQKYRFLMSRGTRDLLPNEDVYLPNFFLNDFVNAGRIWKRSPTIPYLAALKIGASGSLLMATTNLAERIPTIC